jgi:hypothetical protein
LFPLTVVADVLTAIISAPPIRSRNTFVGELLDPPALRELPGCAGRQAGMM